MNYKNPPASRINRRYLLIEGERAAIESALLNYFGVLGWSKAAPLFIPSTKYQLLAVDRGEIVHVRAALALASLPVHGVSGTLKGLRRA